MTSLSPLHRAALRSVVQRFQDASIDFAVGGSVMLQLVGLDFSAGDIDVVTDLPEPGRALTALQGWLPRVTTSRAEPFLSDWVVAATTSEGIAVDVIGGLALRIDDEIARFPFEVATTRRLGDMTVPLANLGHWYHLYRVHDQAKALAIASHLTPQRLEEAGRQLGLASFLPPPAS